MSGVHNATLYALEYARALEADGVHAIHVSVEDEETRAARVGLGDRQPGLPLEVIDSPYRDLDWPVLDYIRARTVDGETIVTVVLPEFIVEKWWHNLLHNQTASTLKRAFLAEPGVVVTNVPYRLDEHIAEDALAR